MARKQIEKNTQGLNRVLTHLKSEENLNFEDVQGAKAEGKTRDVWVQNEKYAEVYTRVYFESQLGIRFVGLTINSGTLEAYVGATRYGNLYGQVKKI